MEPWRCAPVAPGAPVCRQSKRDTGGQTASLFLLVGTRDWRRRHSASCRHSLRQSRQLTLSATWPQLSRVFAHTAARGLVKSASAIFGVRGERCSKFKLRRAIGAVGLPDGNGGRHAVAPLIGFCSDQPVYLAARVSGDRNLWPAPDLQVWSTGMRSTVCTNLSGLVSGGCPGPRWRSACPGPHKTAGPGEPLSVAGFPRHRLTVRLSFSIRSQILMSPSGCLRSPLSRGARSVQAAAAGVTSAANLLPVTRPRRCAPAC
jgi:hypothetical protein